MFRFKPAMAILRGAAEPLPATFNTDCYAEPAASTDPYYTSQGIFNYAVTRGNEGRNNLRQPGINNWDMGLQKSFRLIGEGRELQFRADAFNAFNHTQWSSIDTI